MLRDPRIDKLAQVLVSYSTSVRKGNLVAIVGQMESFPLIASIYEHVLKAGGNPFWYAASDDLDDLFYQYASDEQLAYLNPVAMHLIETVDVRIALWSETNTRRLSGVDPVRQQIAARAQKPRITRMLERAAAGQIRWCGTLMPTEASAQDAEMSLGQYEDFVFNAGLLHLPDPAAAWRDVSARQQRVADFLNTRMEIRFHVPPHGGHDGTDLRVNVDGSTWINCAGHENFPDGEVFAGPRGVDGHVNYTFPGVHNGREVEGIRLVFKGGRVVDASATKNEEFLFKMLDMDEGARVLGEIAIGTNYAIRRFTKNTLFDEKLGGTFHAAVGAGYPESGNSNQSGLHWDMVCELSQRNGCPGGVIEADGQVISRNGRFTHNDWPAP